MTGLLYGLIGSVLIAGAAYIRKSLTADGAIAAVVVGTTLYGLGDLAWFGTMIVFFVTSSVLTKWKRHRKREVERSYAKTGTRDAAQVAANGGLAVVLCIGNALAPGIIWWVAFMGVMAAAAADTWATEVGSTSTRRPVSVITWNKVEPGTSGGITSLGSAAGMAGSALIAFTGVFFAHVERTFPLSAADDVWLIIAITIAGTVGMLGDSVLGAVWQIMYVCPACGQTVEVGEHCGGQTKRLRGVKWMTNDAVNVISTALGGASAALIWLL